MQVEEIHSRVKDIFPAARLRSVIAKINDALDEMYDVTSKRQDMKINVVEDKRFYSLPANIVEIHTVYYKDSDGDYKKIPRTADEPKTGDADG